jgi:hypothetical protein
LPEGRSSRRIYVQTFGDENIEEDTMNEQRVRETLFAILMVVGVVPLVFIAMLEVERVMDVFFVMVGMCVFALIEQTLDYYLKYVR